MPKRSAGLLMYRRAAIGLEVFLVHPGGPFWANKDKGVWTIPKGEYLEGEAPLEAAQREFTEETGFAADGQFTGLGTVKQAGGKIVTVWAFEGDCDPKLLTSNVCNIEWPPRSGRQLAIPEVDRGGWFAMTAANERILKSQVIFLETLTHKLQHIGSLE